MDSSTPVSIKPGDLIELGCGKGGTPDAKVGDTFPLLATDADKQAVVVKIEGDKAWLGPLKPGTFSVTLPCQNAAPVTQSFVLVPLKDSEMPERAPPLGLIGFSYPLWMWIALITALLVVLSSFVWVGIKASKKNAASKTPERPSKPPADQILSLFLKEGVKLAKQSDPTTVQQLYSRGNDCLRAYLEQKFRFKAGWATTSEFIGTFKSLLLGYQGLGTLGPDVEALLTQSDLVRFSKDIPDEAQRRNFVTTIEKIFTTVQKALREPDPDKLNAAKGDSL